MQNYKNTTSPSDYQAFPCSYQFRELFPLKVESWYLVRPRMNGQVIFLINSVTMLWIRQKKGNYRENMKQKNHSAYQESQKTKLM